MRIPSTMIALGLCLGGCSEEKGSDACAIAVLPEVCQTPAPVRGAERITESWIHADPPELQPQPLLDGRYVVTARTFYCAAESDLPSVSGTVQAVLEIRGCVLRTTVFSAAGEPPQVAVWSFAYEPDGTLALHPECGQLPVALLPVVLRGRYGFDGSTLQLVNLGPERSPGMASDSGPDGGSDSPAYFCDSVDTWELR